MTCIIILQVSHPAYLNAACAPVQDAHDLASFAVHMEVQVKFQQVSKYVVADTPESGLHKHKPHPQNTAQHIAGSSATAQLRRWPVTSCAMLTTQNKQLFKPAPHVLIYRSLMKAPVGTVCSTYDNVPV